MLNPRPPVNDSHPLRLLRIFKSHKAIFALAAGGAVFSGQARATDPVNKDAAEEQRTLESWGFHQPEPVDFDDHAGYQQIFDGVSLKGWDGDTSIWRVEKGA